MWPRCWTEVTPNTNNPGHRQMVPATSAAWMHSGGHKRPSGQNPDGCRAPKHLKLCLSTHIYTNHVPVKYTYANKYNKRHNNHNAAPETA